MNISSGTTRRVAVGLGAYASTKVAVNMLSGESFDIPHGPEQPGLA